MIYRKLENERNTCSQSSMGKRGIERNSRAGTCMLTE
jgi:hypothetical protein